MHSGRIIGIGLLLVCWFGDASCTPCRLEESSRQCVLQGKSAQEYFQDGKSHYLKDEYDAAIDDFTKAIGSDPKFVAAYYSRGLVFLDKGEYDKALADFDKVIELSPELASGYVRRGMTQAKKFAYDKSIADFTKAIEIDPKGADAYEGRGRAYNAMSEYDKAISDLTKALELDPADTWTHGDRGDSYNGKGEYSKAIADYTRNIELHPKMQWSYEKRAIAYINNSEYDKAIADYRKALALDLEDTLEYYDAIARCQIKLGKLDDAFSEAENSVALDRKRPGAYGTRALVYRSKKDWKAAVDDYTSALALPVSLSSEIVFRLGRAQAYRELGKVDSASDDVAVAYKLASDMVSQNAGDATVLMGLACTLGLRAQLREDVIERKKDLDLAFKNLADAARVTILRKERLLTDPDMDFLRSDERFKKIVENAK